MILKTVFLAIMIFALSGLIISSYIQPSEASKAFECNGVFTNMVIDQNIFVPSDGKCQLLGDVIVNGNISAKGNLQLWTSTVNGNILAIGDSSTWIVLAKSNTVNGNLKIVGKTTSLRDTVVNGNLMVNAIIQPTQSTEISKLTVSGNFKTHHLDDGALIFRNTVEGNAWCTAFEPVGLGNIVSGKNFGCPE